MDNHCANHADPMDIPNPLLKYKEYPLGEIAYLSSLKLGLIMP